MDPQEITKDNLARQLVAKHQKALNIVKEEYEKYMALENKLDTEAAECRKKRDELNENVQKLKDERQNNYSESKRLRKEFMTNLQKKKEMKDIPMEVMILTKQIDQLEWEIQTEAVNVDDEKKLVKQIQDSLDRLHNYANMYKEHEVVSHAVSDLTKKLHQKLNSAEENHTKMLNFVDESDKYHKRFVEAMVQLRDARAKRIGFQRDSEKHQKGIEHWQKVYDKETRSKKKGKKSVEPAPEKEPVKESVKEPQKEPEKKTEKTAGKEMPEKDEKSDVKPTDEQPAQGEENTQDSHSEEDAESKPTEQPKQDQTTKVDESQKENETEENKPENGSEGGESNNVA
jgi:uncharacterized coiled-coil DUF342 family protein